MISKKKKFDRNYCKDKERLNDSIRIFKLFFTKIEDVTLNNFIKFHEAKFIYTRIIACEDDSYNLSVTINGIDNCNDSYDDCELSEINQSFKDEDLLYYGKFCVDSDKRSINNMDVDEVYEENMKFIFFHKAPVYIVCQNDVGKEIKGFKIRDSDVGSVIYYLKNGEMFIETPKIRRKRRETKSDKLICKMIEIQKKKEELKILQDELENNEFNNDDER